MHVRRSARSERSKDRGNHDKIKFGWQQLLHPTLTLLLLHFRNSIRTALCRLGQATCSPACCAHWVELSDGDLSVEEEWWRQIFRLILDARPLSK